jgi:pectin methylesterase-like acyl-CoA thioesterase
MFGVDASDFVLENITLHNTTPYQGSQAEAFRGYGARALLNRVNLSSFQDTLLLQNTAFVTNSYIEGDVDFMSGGGPVFFEYCELKALHAGYYTQIRNGQGVHGNVYVNSTLTRDPTLAENTVYLGRIDPTPFPYSEVVFINTAMDTHVRRMQVQESSRRVTPSRSTGVRRPDIPPRIGLAHTGVVLPTATTSPRSPLGPTRRPGSRASTRASGEVRSSSATFSRTERKPRLVA